MSRKLRLHHALTEKLKPDTLLVEDESNRHHVPVGAETHFKVVAVSTEFEHLNRVDRHRMINTLFADEFIAGLHALSLHLYTPTEWVQASSKVLPSPACRDGKRHD